MNSFFMTSFHKTSLRALLAFVLLVSCECLFAADGANKILVLGDSLSAGYGIRPEQGWVHLMRKELQVKYGAQVINASVSGETSSGGRARLPALLAQHHPDILLLELGGNDGLRGQPLAILEENLQAMIDAGKKSGAQVLLIGMQIPGNYGPRYTSEFKKIYARSASKNTVPLVPFLLGDIPLKPELMQADRIHPTAEPQGTIMSTVLPVLLPMLKFRRLVAKPLA